MKTRHYVILGLLALALALSPILPPGDSMVAWAETPDEQIAKLLAIIENLQSQIVELQIQNLLRQIKILQLSEPCGQPGAVYNYQTGQLCSLQPVVNSVIITSPTAGDIWRPGETRQIRWTTTGAFAANERVQIDLVNTRYGLASGQLLSDGVVTINVPYDVLPNSGYQIKISDYSQSNRWPDSYSDYFTISSSTPGNLPPTISGVSGPTTLNVGQSGTWTVTASDPENGSLAYAIRWGDETTNGKGVSAPRGVANLQTATFTHTYANAGTYNPTFTVTDNAGQSAQTSLSVVIQGGVTQPIPSIVSSNPPDGAIDARNANDGAPNLPVSLTFSGPVDASIINFLSLSTSWTEPAAMLGIRDYGNINPNTFGFSLSRRLIPGERIRITHTPSNTSICLGFLPGDVNQDGFSSFGDVTYLLGLRQSNPNAPLYQTDIDRNGVFDVNDVTALGALFSAGQGDKALPACPPSPTGGSGSGGGGGASSFVSQSQLANSFSALSALLQSLRASLAR